MQWWVTRKAKANACERVFVVPQLSGLLLQFFDAGQPQASKGSGKKKRKKKKKKHAPESLDPLGKCVSVNSGSL